MKSEIPNHNSQISHPSPLAPPSSPLCRYVVVGALGDEMVRYRCQGCGHERVSHHPAHRLKRRCDEKQGSGDRGSGFGDQAEGDTSQGPTRQNSIPENLASLVPRPSFLDPCLHRGPVLGSVVSDLCGQVGRRLPLAACAIHHLCVPNRVKRRGSRHRECLGCAECGDGNGKQLGTRTGSWNGR